MPANRSVGVPPLAGGASSERNLRAERREGFGECLQKLKKTGGEAAALPALLPLVAAPAAALPPDEPACPVPERGPQEAAGDGAPASGMAEPERERSGARPCEATPAGDGRGLSVASPPGAAVPAPAALDRKEDAGPAPLPDAVLERLAEAVRQAAREQREVTVLELEPPGGGVVEIRLENAAVRPALRLVCHGWDGYLPLARDLPALQTRLLQAGVVLQDISLQFERRAGGARADAGRGERVSGREPGGDEDESDGTRAPAAMRRRRR